jgi:stress responsive alpha/beta barrel protein
MLRHVVVWAMEPGKEEALDDLLGAMQRLPDEIDTIEALSCGRLFNDSPYDAVLCVDLDDEAALATYRAHPAHKPVLDELRDVAATVVVADYLF